MTMYIYTNACSRNEVDKMSPHLAGQRDVCVTQWSEHKVQVPHQVDSKLQPSQILSPWLISNKIVLSYVKLQCKNLTLHNHGSDVYVNRKSLRSSFMQWLLPCSLSLPSFFWVNADLFMRGKQVKSRWFFVVCSFHHFMVYASKSFPEKDSQKKDRQNRL